MSARRCAALRYLEQARDRDHLYEITELALRRVPIVCIPGFTMEQNHALRRMNQSVLHTAQLENQHREVLIVNNLRFDGSPITILGSLNRVNYADHIEIDVLKSNSYAGELIFAHNHPSTRAFSLVDLAMFLVDEYIGVFSVVTNLGQVYVLYKLEHFDYHKARGALELVIDQFALKRYPSDEERQERAARMLLRKLQKGGVWYGKSNG